MTWITGRRKLVIWLAWTISSSPVSSQPPARAHTRHQRNEQQQVSCDFIVLPEKRCDQAQEEILGNGRQPGRGERLPEMETLRKTVAIGNKIGGNTPYQDGADSAFHIDHTAFVIERYR